jgi:hypothetical protein
MGGGRRTVGVWTASQRVVLLVALVVLLVALVVRLVMFPSYVSDPQPERGARYDQLADRIDPNTADWQALSALPLLGEKRAREIVAFRERYAREHGGAPAFTGPDDLMRVRGIGPTMAEQLAPYLLFDAAGATTRPSATAPDDHTSTGR